MLLDQTNDARRRKKIFCMKGLTGTLTGATKAIFEFQPRSRDISLKSTFFEPQFDPIKTLRVHILASRMKFKNYLGSPS